MKLNKKVTIFGKQISAVALALIAIAGLASAGLLSYYGLITGTATVKQSVRLSENGVEWKECPDCEITWEYDGVAGATDVKGPYYLKNFAEVPATVEFETECCNSTPECGYEEACEGITTTYWMKSEEVIHEVSAILDDANKFNDVSTKITKTDMGDAVKFKVEILSENVPHGVYGVGIAIAITDVEPAFQVYFAEFGDKLWHYQVYAPGWSGYDTTTLPEGITATGVATEKVFTITIDKSLLGGIGATYHYAIQFRTNLLGTYPEGINLWGLTYPEGIGSYATQTVGTSLPSALTLEPAQELSFWIKNSFHIALIPDTYTITTEIQPA